MGKSARVVPVASELANIPNPRACDMADCWGLDVLVEPLIARFGSHCAILVGFLIAINFMRQECLLAERIGAVAEEEIPNTHNGNVEPSSAGDWPASV